MHQSCVADVIQIRIVRRGIVSKNEYLDHRCYERQQHTVPSCVVCTFHRADPELVFRNQQFCIAWTSPHAAGRNLVALWFSYNQDGDTDVAHEDGLFQQVRLGGRLPPLCLRLHRHRRSEAEGQVGVGRLPHPKARCPREYVAVGASYT